MGPVFKSIWMYCTGKHRKWRFCLNKGCVTLKSGILQPRFDNSIGHAREQVAAADQEPISYLIELYCTQKICPVSDFNPYGVLSEITLKCSENI